MSFECNANHFETEGEAIANIEAAGGHAVAFDFPAKDGDWHWHDFDSEVWVVSGALGVVFEDSDALFEYPAGTRVIAPCRVIHREVHGDYRAVIGFSIDPATLTQPIDKPPADLA